MSRTRCIAMLSAIAPLALTAASALAANVYVFGTGNTAVNQAYVNALTAGGHTVTIGVQGNQFNGTVDLSGIDVVITTYGPNWGGSGGIIPTIGQQQLVDWVTIGGGGLITTEWTLYASSSFPVLTPILPVTYGNSWNSLTSTTFTNIDPNPIMIQNLPASFTVTTDNHSGVESLLTAKLGAQVFFQSSNLSATNTMNAGASGWQAGAGRTASLSTIPGVNSLGNVNYATMLSNLVSWVADEGFCPVCPADFDQDGGVTGADVSAFFGQYEEGASCADTDLDGGVSPADIATFFVAFEAGGC
jgi:hypothetical protein